MHSSQELENSDTVQSDTLSYLEFAKIVGIQIKEEFDAMSSVSTFGSYTYPKLDMSIFTPPDKPFVPSIQIPEQQLSVNISRDKVIEPLDMEPLRQELLQVSKSMPVDYHGSPPLVERRMSDILLSPDSVQSVERKGRFLVEKSSRRKSIFRFEVMKDSRPRLLSVDSGIGLDFDQL